MISKNKSITLVTCLITMVGIVAAGGMTFAQQTVRSSTVRPAGVTGDLIDIQKADDGNTNTRATSGKTDYVGMSVTIDAGGLQNIIGVKQDFGPWATHYPGAYKVEVAESLSGPWMTAFEGPGERGESRVEFPAILARYVRITATAKNTTYPGQDWSIAELKLGVDPGQTARRIVARPDRTPEPIPPKPAPGPAPKTFQDLGLATDNNLETRASSGTANYEGMSFTIDLGGEFELTRVVQFHGRWAEDYPAVYKIEVSRQANESRVREVWRGEGRPTRSVARFDPVTTRYIRFTALRHRDNSHWWSIAEIRTNRDPDVVDDDEALIRQIRGVTSQGFSNAANVADDSNTTRATTNKANYAGSWLQADLGGSYTISRVVMVHEPDREDFARRYKIELSLDGRQWQPVFEGRGEPGRSVASFNPVRSRFVRITALAERDTQHWWSIYRLKISG
jgi:hypothetical protein